MTTSFLTPIITRFAAELEAAIRQQAETAILEALRGGRPSKRATMATASPARSTGQKRTPEHLEALTRSLQDYISKNPGQRIEQIAVGMKCSTKELTLPIRKLVAGRAIKTKGQKRATSYTASGGGK